MEVSAVNRGLKSKMYKKIISALKDDFDALILSKISDIIHSLFKVYKTSFTIPFGQIAPHFVKLLVSLV